MRDMADKTLHGMRKKDLHKGSVQDRTRKCREIQKSGGQFENTEKIVGGNGMMDVDTTAKLILAAVIFATIIIGAMVVTLMAKAESEEEE